MNLIVTCRKGDGYYCFDIYLFRRESCMFPTRMPLFFFYIFQVSMEQVFVFLFYFYFSSTFPKYISLAVFFQYTVFLANGDPSSETNHPLRTDLRLLPVTVLWVCPTGEKEIHVDFSPKGSLSLNYSIFPILSLSLFFYDLWTRRHSSKMSHYCTTKTLSKLRLIC